MDHSHLLVWDLISICYCLPFADDNSNTSDISVDAIGKSYAVNDLLLLDINFYRISLDTGDNIEGKDISASANSNTAGKKILSNDKDENGANCPIVNDPPKHGKSISADIFVCLVFDHFRY